jgi:tetratricopeptide (TPR) repeat protein
LINIKATLLPGHILLLGNLFDLQDLGGQDLKGMGGPVRAWVALRPASVQSRFEALHGIGLTELVGREEELEILLRRWSKTKTGEGQVVLLSGEAGIGKSRLTVAVLERLATEPHIRLRYFCSAQHTDSALYPIIGQMERAAGLAHRDSAQVKLDKLDALLAQTSTAAQDVSLFADMLSLPRDGRYPALDMTSEQRRKRTLEALGSQVEALSRSTPVLMIFEDAHWIDPTSLEALSTVVDRLRTLRVLLIVTFRPEFGPPWIGRPYVTALTINRLARRDVEAVIDRVVGNKAATLMHALANTSPTLIHRGDYAEANALLNELSSLASEKGASLWKAVATVLRGRILALTGETSDAVQMITSGLTAFRATGATLWEPHNLSYLARVHAECGSFDEAVRCIRASLTMVERSKERWCEAEVNRVAGEIALMLPDADTTKTEAYFERALAVARQQQAKSWELRAAMSMARLWGDQGKRDEARELLAPVYGWFTEGFDTRDLKEAKALLDDLAA